MIAWLLASWSTAVSVIVPLKFTDDPPAMATWSSGPTVVPPPPVPLRGWGAPVAKSAALSSVSCTPLFLRSTAKVLLGAGVRPLPSKQLAVVP